MWILLAVSLTNLALGFGTAVYMGHGPDFAASLQGLAKKPKH